MAQRSVLSLVITARDRAGRAFNSFRGRLQRLRRQVFSVQGALVAMAGAAVVGRTVQKWVRAFGKQEDAVVSLRSALIATGKDGSAALRDLQEEAVRLQQITKFGDEEILDATAKLAQLAPSLRADELREAQSAVVALAETFFKGDLANAATMLGKTLGSTTNALSRYGITIEDTAAPASEKLAGLLGNEMLAAAFDVAQDKATTLNGRLKQLSNASGDAQEVLGGVVAEAIGLTGEAEGLTNRVQEWTASVRENRRTWVAWTRVVIQGLKFVGQTVLSVIRLAFNVGQVIGNALRGTFSLLAGALSELFNRLVAGPLNSFLSTLDSIPGVNIDFRIAGAPADAFFRDFREQTENTWANVLDGVDAVKDLGGAWMDVYRASEEAARAQGEAAEEASRAQPPVGGGGGGREGSGGFSVSVGATPDVLSGGPASERFVETVSRKLPQAADLIRDAYASMSLDSREAILGVVSSLREMGFTMEDVAEGLGLPVEKVREMYGEMQDVVQTANQAVQTALIDTFTTLGERIGQVIAGVGKGFQGLKDALLSILGALLQTVGKAMIAFGVAGEAIKSFITNPALAIAAGTALVALGSALASSAQESVASAGASLAGGGSAAAASSIARSQTGQIGGARRGEAVVVIRGGLLDMSDPRQERALAGALEDLSGRRVTVRKG